MSGPLSRVKPSPPCETHLNSSQNRAEVLGCATHSSGGKRQRGLGFTLKCLFSPPTHRHPGLRFGLSPAPGVQNLFAESFCSTV